MHLCSHRDQGWLLMWVPGPRASTAVLATVVLMGRVGKDSGSWSLRTQKPVGPSAVKSAGGLQNLCSPLVSSVAKAAGVLCGAVQDGVLSDKSCGCPQHPQRLLESSAAKAAGVLCRVGHWEPRSLYHTATSGHGPSHLSLLVSRCVSYVGLWVW